MGTKPKMLAWVTTVSLLLFSPVSSSAIPPRNADQLENSQDVSSNLEWASPFYDVTAQTTDKDIEDGTSDSLLPRTEAEPSTTKNSMPRPLPAPGITPRDTDHSIWRVWCTGNKSNLEDVASVCVGKPLEYKCDGNGKIYYKAASKICDFFCFCFLEPEVTLDFPPRAATETRVSTDKVEESTSAAEDLAQISSKGHENTHSDESEVSSEESFNNALVSRSEIDSARGWNLACHSFDPRNPQELVLLESLCKQSPANYRCELRNGRHADVQYEQKSYICTVYCFCYIKFNANSASNMQVEGSDNNEGFPVDTEASAADIGSTTPTLTTRDEDVEQAGWKLICTDADRVSLDEAVKVCRADPYNYTCDKDGNLKTGILNKVCDFFCRCAKSIPGWLPPDPPKLTLTTRGQDIEQQGWKLICTDAAGAHLGPAEQVCPAAPYKYSCDKNGHLKVANFNRVCDFFCSCTHTIPDSLSGASPFEDPPTLNRKTDVLDNDVDMLVPRGLGIDSEAQDMDHVLVCNGNDGFPNRAITSACAKDPYYYRCIGGHRWQDLERHWCRNNCECVNLNPKCILGSQLKWRISCGLFKNQDQDHSQPDTMDAPSQTDEDTDDDSAWALTANSTFEDSWDTDLVLNHDSSLSKRHLHDDSASLEDLESSLSHLPEPLRSIAHDVGAKQTPFNSKPEYSLLCLDDTKSPARQTTVTCSDQGYHCPSNGHMALKSSGEYSAACNGWCGCLSTNPSCVVADKYVLSSCFSRSLDRGGLASRGSADVQVPSTAQNTTAALHDYTVICVDKEGIANRVSTAVCVNRGYQCDRKGTIGLSRVGEYSKACSTACGCVSINPNCIVGTTIQQTSCFRLRSESFPPTEASFKPYLEVRDVELEDDFVELGISDHLLLPSRDDTSPARVEAEEVPVHGQSEGESLGARGEASGDVSTTATTSLTTRDVQHNFALVCLTWANGDPSQKNTKKCSDLPYGYGCNGDGDVKHHNKHADCEVICKCWQVSKPCILAGALNPAIIPGGCFDKDSSGNSSGNSISSANSNSSAENADLNSETSTGSAPLPEIPGSPIVPTPTEGSLISTTLTTRDDQHDDALQHNYALVCLTWSNGDPSRERTKTCSDLPLGYGCDANGRLAFHRKDTICEENCKCWSVNKPCILNANIINPAIAAGCFDKDLSGSEKTEDLTSKISDGSESLPETPGSDVPVPDEGSSRATILILAARNTEQDFALVCLTGQHGDPSGERTIECHEEPFYYNCNADGGLIYGSENVACSDLCQCWSVSPALASRDAAEDTLTTAEVLPFVSETHPTMLTVRDAQHNYALVCTWNGEVSRWWTEICQDSPYRFNCNSSGKVTKSKADENCSLTCRCWTIDKPCVLGAAIAMAGCLDKIPNDAKIFPQTNDPALMEASSDTLSRRSLEAFTEIIDPRSLEDSEQNEESGEVADANRDYYWDLFCYDQVHWPDLDGGLRGVCVTGHFKYSCNFFGDKVEKEFNFNCDLFCFCKKIPNRCIVTADGNIRCGAAALKETKLFEIANPESTDQHISSGEQVAQLNEEQDNARNIANVLSRDHSSQEVDGVESVLEAEASDLAPGNVTGSTLQAAALNDWALVCDSPTTETFDRVVTRNCMSGPRWYNCDRNGNMVKGRAQTTCENFCTCINTSGKCIVTPLVTTCISRLGKSYTQDAQVMEEILGLNGEMNMLAQISSEDEMSAINAVDEEIESSADVASQDLKRNPPKDPRSIVMSCDRGEANTLECLYKHYHCDDDGVIVFTGKKADKVCARECICHYLDDKARLLTSLPVSPSDDTLTGIEARSVIDARTSDDHKPPELSDIKPGTQLICRNLLGDSAAEQLALAKYCATKGNVRCHGYTFKPNTYLSSDLKCEEKCLCFDDEYNPPDYSKAGANLETVLVKRDINDLPNVTGLNPGTKLLCTGLLGNSDAEQVAFATYCYKDGNIRCRGSKFLFTPRTWPDTDRKCIDKCLCVEDFDIPPDHFKADVSAEKDVLDNDLVCILKNSDDIDLRGSQSLTRSCIDQSVRCDATGNVVLNPVSSEQCKSACSCRPYVPPPMMDPEGVSAGGPVGPVVPTPFATVTKTVG